MSQYTHAYIKHNEDFIEVGSWGRSSHIAQELNGILPYEKIRKVEKTTIDNLLNTLQEKIKDYQKDILAYQNKKLMISNFNNPMEDKLDAIRNIDETIADYQEEVDDLNITFGRALELYNLADDYELYMGIEVYQPTQADVVE